MPRFWYRNRIKIIKAAPKKNEKDNVLKMYGIPIMFAILIMGFWALLKHHGQETIMGQPPAESEPQVVSTPLSPAKEQLESAPNLAFSGPDTQDLIPSRHPTGAKLQPAVIVHVIVPEPQPVVYASYNASETNPIGINPSKEDVIAFGYANAGYNTAPAEVMFAVCEYESGGMRQYEADGTTLVQGKNPSSTDWGMCQINDYWHPDLVAKAKAGWQENFAAGWAIMNECWTRWEGDLMSALGCYNGTGPEDEYAKRVSEIYETRFWERYGRPIWSPQQSASGKTAPPIERGGVFEYSISANYTSYAPSYNMRWFFQHVSGGKAVDPQNFNGQVCIGPGHTLEVNNHFGNYLESQGFLTWVHPGDGACNTVSMLREAAAESGLITRYVSGSEETEVSSYHDPVAGVAEKYWTTIWACDDCSNEKDVLIVNPTENTVCLKWSIQGDYIYLWVE